ncbi:MAG: paraquat-inducible protein A [Colwellia sp.]|nr:paraquat-inducible protein A [Colwellia sp.]
MSHSSINNMLACHQCDSLLPMPLLSEGQKAYCGCCGAALFSKKKDAINRTIAVAIAGLLLLLPAILLPIIGIGAAGLYNDASLVDCITVLIDTRNYIIAFAVFMFTIAIPTVRLFTALYISLCIKFNRTKPSLLVFFRSYHILDTWTMIHVFFMGVIISMYKLSSLADMTIDGGLFSLVLLLLCSTLVSVTMDQHSIWHKLEQALE